MDNMSKRIETWADFKKAVENAGVSNDTRIGGISVTLDGLVSLDVIDTDNDSVIVFDGDRDWSSNQSNHKGQR